MTYLVNFSRRPSALPDLDYLWYFDWIGTLDAGYHWLSANW